MFRPLLAALLGAVAVSLPAASTASPAPTLNAVVGTADSFTISLKNPDGSAVRHLDPGMYTIGVDDKSTLHNFHLTGPGVDQMTSVDNIETASWTVVFQDGTYTYKCDAHPVQMKGSFTVGALPPVPAQLNGKVTAKAISLTSKGTRVRALFEGSYRFVITDSVRTQNFHLTGPGVNRKTGIRAKTKATWNLKLTPGKYVYRSDKSRRLRRTFTVKAKVPPA